MRAVFFFTKERVSVGRRVACEWSWWDARPRGGTIDSLLFRV